MIKIAVIKGDGTGPEVINEALKVLGALEAKFNLALNFDVLPFHAGRYLKEGKTLSDEELENLKSYDAILLGAIGDARVKPGILEREILLKIRFGLDQYINYRPVTLYEGVQTPLHFKDSKKPDYIVIRENCSGLYKGYGETQKKGSTDELAIQEMHYSYKEVKRCLRFAFQTVRKRHFDSPWVGLSPEDRAQGFCGKLTLCGKSNVLSYVFDLWMRVFEELQAEFPDVKCDYVHVDACCIYMVESPQRFDVIVTTNMFGDIITDLAAVTQGGLGVSAGANINPESVSMFEPIGGTAPDFTGLNQINPIAAISAAQLMIDYLGFNEPAKAIELAKMKVISQMKSQAAGKMGFSTSEIGDLFVKELA